MKGKVIIDENKERHASCNCCSGSDKPEKLWDVKFTFRNRTTLIRVCKEHLKELETEIKRQLS